MKMFAWCFACLGVTLHSLAYGGTLRVGDRGPFADVNKTLTAEHQEVIGKAWHAFHPEDPKRFKKLTMEFRANPQGEIYILLIDSNRPPQTTLVYAKLRNAHFRDPQQRGFVPKTVPADSPLAKTLRAGGPATEYASVWIYGDALGKLPDGSEAVTGSITVVTSTPKDKSDTFGRDGAMIFETSPSGQLKMGDANGIDFMMSFAGIQMTKSH